METLDIQRNSTMITVLHRNEIADAADPNFWVDPGAYYEVAQVDSDDLGKAYGLTNHIEKDWTKNSRVAVVPGAPLYRSSSVGDILLRHSDGHMYLIMGVGYRKVQWGDSGFHPYLDPGDDLPEDLYYPEP